VKATTPCSHCHKTIEADCRSREDLDRAMAAAGAIWDRGWFCSVECRDAFNTYGPQNGWERALGSLKPKPTA
jgi:hypothetical protein